MKPFLLVLAFLTVCLSGVRGQVVDTAAVVREVDSLIQISRELTGNQDFEQALTINAMAENITLQKLGFNTASNGSVCFNRGRIFDFKREYSEAEKWYLNSKSIREKVLGKNHPDYARTLNNLGNLYQIQGDYLKAEPLHLEAKEIRAKTLGKEHPDYVMSLSNLASLYYYYKSDYAKAEQLYLEALEICERTDCKNHPNYATYLNNLGTLYEYKGDYEKAEVYYIKAMEVRAKTLGVNHSGYANSLNHLGILYGREGDLDKAKYFLEEAKKIWTLNKNTEGQDYFKNLIGLANTYLLSGEYNKAEPLYLESKEIATKKLGTQHIYYANALIHLGTLYLTTGDYSKAEPLYLEAKEIKAKTMGKEHPDYAGSLKNLGDLYSNQGHYSKAEPLYLEAKEVLVKSLGNEHLDYAWLLHNLGVLYLNKGDRVNAKSNYLEANTIIRKLIEQYVAYSSERQLLAFNNIFKKQTDQFLSFSQQDSSSELVKRTLDNALFFNGLLQENARHLSSSVATADSLTRETFERWQGCRRRLANEYAKPIAERQYVEEVEAEAEGYEKILTRNLPAFSEARRIPHWQDVQAQLKPNEAAIEFIDFKYYNPDPTDSTLYAALVLRPLPAGASAKEGNWSAPKWVTLCEQRQLDALLNNNNQRTESITQLYSPKKETFRVIDEEPPALYDLVWGPLDSLLDGVKTVYFAPSGLLHRLNLGALPINDKQTLSDRYNLHQVNSTRELVIPTQLTPGLADALVYGGIQYEMDSTSIRSGIDGKDSILVGTEEISFSSVDISLRGDAWTYLPGTEKESSEVGKLLTKKGLKTTLRQGYAASEESFKKMGRDGQPSPKILHIATHGFFFPDPKDTLQSKHWMADREPAFKMSDHPMIRSGLLMAGGNAAWTNQARPSDLEDGILTAYEISQMNLRNTELVVLSACETGLGDIQGNEGVYGLQRAFRIAGAKYLLMSLWKVPDVQTQELMTAFYKEWSGEKTIPEAFRAAQNVMRKKYPGKPFLWAGFVLVE